MNTNLLKNIKEVALELNFCNLVITKPHPDILAEYQRKDKIYPIGLDYLNKNHEVRENPNLILEHCQCIICVAIKYCENFENEKNILKAPSKNNNIAIISRYANARDYHKTLKKKLQKLGTFLKNIYPNLNFRAITDSVPFYEQFYAEFTNNVKLGKNHLISLPQIGSGVFLGELLLDFDLVTELLKDNHLQPNADFLFNEKTNTFKITLFPSQEEQDLNKLEKYQSTCLTNCQACQKHCPTKAINEQEFKVENCISYLTIECDAEIPTNLIKAMGLRVYGCDNCQIFCPKNNITKLNPKFTVDPDFNIRFKEDDLHLEKLLLLKKEEFTKQFAGTPIMHAGYEKFMRNVFSICANASPNTQIIDTLKQRITEFPQYKSTILFALAELTKE